MGIEKFIDNEVKSNDVVLFMKGTPQFPMCGFSGQVVQILDHLGVAYKGLNVLESDDLRNGIKAYSNWPTIPQLYVKGEFVGGCDIIREMFQAGELQQTLKEKGVVVQPDRLSGLAHRKNENPCRAAGVLFCRAPVRASARVIFDHQMRLHLHRVRHVGEHRNARELGGHLGAVDLDVVGHVALGQGLRFDDQRHLLRGFLDLDHVADLERGSSGC